MSAYVVEDSPLARLGDEVLRTRAALSQLESAANANSQIGRPVLESLKRMWIELDLLGAEVRSLDTSNSAIGGTLDHRHENP